MAPVDVIAEKKDFYPYLVAPASQLVDQELIARVTRLQKTAAHWY